MASPDVTQLDTEARARIDAIITGAEDQECLSLSQLAEVSDELDLDDDQARVVHEYVEAAGFNVSDDCARVEVPSPGAAGAKRS